MEIDHPKAEALSQPSRPADTQTEKKSSKRWGSRFVISAVVAIAGGLLIAHEVSRGKPLVAGNPTDLITVPVVKIHRENLVRSETFDAEFRSYQVIDLHAEAAGFVKSINVDIGDRVQKGDLLATLEIPELAQDIEHAAATKARDEKLADEAAANYEDAHLTFSRLTAIDKRSPHLVAKQDLDTARAKDAAVSASMAAAQEDVKVAQAALDRFMAIQDNCKIVAPFSGVITKRYADVGAFVQGGVSPSGAAMPLVRLSQNDRLRLDFPVSVSYVHLIKEGDPVSIRITATGRTIDGKVSRFTHNVDMDTRTMETEVDVSNGDFSITPGVYAEARLDFEWRTNALTVPAEALTDLKTPTAFVVSDGDVIVERPLKLGLSTPDKFEILAGLQESDLVLIGNRSQVKPGQKVDVKMIEMANLQ